MKAESDVRRSRLRSGIAVLTLALALGGCDKKKPAPNAGSRDKAPAGVGGGDAAAPPAKVVSGTAAQLAAEFRRDEQAARDKYDAVEVEVSGPVARTYAKEPAGAYGSCVIVGEGEDVVWCYTKDPEPWLRVAPGQQVKLRGRTPSGMVNGFVILGAEFIGGPPEPRRYDAVTAEQMAAEYARDKAAFAERYKDRPLIVTGTVDQVDHKTFVYLRAGGGPFRVMPDFALGSYMADAATNLAPGTPVKLLCDRVKVSTEDYDKKLVLHNCKLLKPE